MVNRTVLAVMVAAGLAAGAAGQTVVSGPTVNPANGHRYTLIQATSWEQARGWARARGSDLATVEDLAENAWIYAAFNANNSRKYLIGLADVDHPGSLEWSDGSGSGYRRWATGEPGNANPGHRYVTVQGDQMWYVRGTNYAPYYVVESSGPLRVPQEYPSVGAALQGMLTLGVDEVDIAAGVYTIPADMSFTVPPTRTARVRGAGPSATSIVVVSEFGGLGLSGNWDLEGLQFIRGGTGALISPYGGTTRARNITVDGGGISARAAAVQVDATSQFLARTSTFQNLPVVVSAGFSGGHAAFDSCLFFTDAVVVAAGVTADFRGCTLRAVGGGRSTVFGSPVNLSNSIVYDLAGTLTSSPLTARFCDIQGAAALGLTDHVIDADPRFTSILDHTLRPDSPCLDAGSADEPLTGTDLAGQSRISGPAPDMGAFETQTPACPVDFNGDGFVDFFDYDDFVAAFEGGC